jgi:hypothetical protein
MPYYRIVIWTKRRKKPFSGIRLLPDPNINSIYQMARSQAESIYPYDFIDVEVQMLSKLCRAVQEFEKKVVKKPSVLE